MDAMPLASSPAASSPAAAFPASPVFSSAAARMDWLRQMPLEPWLEVGDPLAEAVVAGLRARHIPLANPLAAIRRLAAEGDAACRDLLLDMETPAPWADFDRMRQGGRMALRHFPQLIIALVHGGLMTTFSSADAAYILASTNRLEQNVVRRLFESSTLFFGVLDADALRPGGKVWETCLQVRLMHTMVRLRMEGSGSWPLPGRPINAVHTSAGPLFFGAMVLERLRLLGASITTEEADGYYLLWRHVTRLLGVPLELLGNTAEEQAVLDARILPLSFSPDANSRKLAEVLLTGFRRLPDAEWVPRGVHEVLVRYMLGEQRANAMGIPPHPLGTRIAGLVAQGLKPYGWLQRIPALAQRTERFGRRYLDNMLSRGLAGVAADFQPH